ncbi:MULTISPECIES: LysR family transcriptional regulator [unclassified Bordetella]|uniref:LysR family transcriptional regulator n=1 Tax=unclassified Bordetella TaxID=2630031 RepID=UPI00132A8A1F|nr:MULTISPECIES: LysR family transcriptional regulator [unclassified Bordetella]MVW70746.1 LysR family transcriptional regulator [Bordetella sp. 15P40C-2]MVW80513.1 LysR family transcriptional regulator [Bordetella sp. 02P26C-1]
MTLKQLEAFYLAATSPNFMVAAERLHISVSTLSKRITDLEHSLRSILFDRSSLRARLTSEGEQLLPHVEQLLKQANYIVGLGRQTESLRGRCHFGVGELSALTWLASFIAQLQKAHPNLQLDPVVEAGSSLGNLARRVAEGDLDFAVVANRPTDTRIKAEFLGSAGFVWVCAPDLAREREGRLSAMLPDVALISLPPSSGTALIIEQSLRSIDALVTRRLHCNSWAVIAQLLIQGLGLGVLPESWANQLVEAGTLVRLRGVPPLAALDYFLISRERDLRPLVGACLDIACQVVNFKPQDVSVLHSPVNGHTVS